jgi:endonuclease/exonuclease/phosphatase family protein
VVGVDVAVADVERLACFSDTARLPFIHAFDEIRGKRLPYRLRPVSGVRSAVSRGAGSRSLRMMPSGGFKTAMRQRSPRRVGLVALLALLLVGSGCQGTDDAQKVVKDRFRLSVMTLNIAGALPRYSSNPEIDFPWRDRYARIAAGLASSGTAPDVIALQEVTARKEWVGTRNPQDYESVHYLLSRMKATVGIEYRIAYLGAAPSGEPGLIQGQAVLYNPARLKNITRAPGASVLPGDSTPSTVGVHPRRSYPCASPAGEFQALCSLLDGDGVYYTSVWADDKSNMHFETGAVRFAFTADDQYGFTFYNVHLHPTEAEADDKSSPAARNLISFMEGLRFTGTAYPPIVAGDFNGGIERFPTFTQLAAGDGIDYVIGGLRSSYPSTYGFSVVKQAVLPGPSQNPDGMCAPRDVAWSDHCAVVAYLEPSI